MVVKFKTAFLIIASTYNLVPSLASTIDDSISFKSLVLGSLHSGQNASGRFAFLMLRNAQIEMSA